MTYDQGVRLPDEDRVRGLMLGLLLGDGYDELSGDGLIHGTCVSQLAMYTLEGLVRACVRSDHKGICHPPSVVWHAWCRWAHRQGLGASFIAHWEGGSAHWPDGWLHQVAPLAERRGNAPATVTALRAGPQTPTQPRTGSNGYHAVTRSLPVAVVACGLGEPHRLAVEIAALTHGSEAAQSAAGLAATTAYQVLLGAPDALFDAAGLTPAAPGTAVEALRQGALAAQAAHDLTTALLSAAPHGRGATTVAGALYGAATGVAALPSDLLQRLEAGWAADLLARDALLEVTTHPSGSDYSTPADATWWARYPGW